MCSCKGSQHERIAYAILDQLPCIKHYAVEVYADRDVRELVARHHPISKHAWDVMVAPPYKVLIEVHGEQHTSKLDTRSNSIDSCLSSRATRDHALAAAAVEAGYSVVWLMADTTKGTRRRWLQEIKKAISDADAGRPAKLYIA